MTFCLPERNFLPHIQAISARAVPSRAYMVLGSFAHFAPTYEIWSSATVAPAAKVAASKMLPGAAFACCNIFVGYPFDTVKTRLQLQLHPSSRWGIDFVPRNRWSLFWRFFFFRGIVVSLIQFLIAVDLKKWKVPGRMKKRKLLYHGFGWSPRWINGIAAIYGNHPCPTVRHCLQELGRGGAFALQSSLYRGASLPLLCLLLKQPVEFAAFECSSGSYYGGLLAGFMGALISCPFNMAKIWVQCKPAGSRQGGQNNHGKTHIPGYRGGGCW